MAFEIQKPEPASGGVVSLRLSPKDYAMMHELAKKNELSIGTLARQMVEHCLKELRDKDEED